VCRTTPVDALMSDTWAGQFQDFDQVDLFPLGCLSRVLPDERLAIEHELSGAVPAHQVVGPSFGAASEEMAKLVVAMEYPAGLIQNAGHERAFQGGVRKVQLK
jgi:hypothetical protein